jgi:malonyl-CoA/methylmalonyl-CoA synthetase
MEFVRRAATRFASRPAIGTITLAEGDITSKSSPWADYGSIVRRAERVASSLPLPPRATAVPIATPAGNAALVGPRVAIWGAPGPEFVASLFACYLSGAAAVPLSPQQPQHQLAQTLDDCGACALLAPERLLSSSSSPSVLNLLKDLSAAHRIPLVAVEDVERATRVAAATANDEDDNDRQRKKPDDADDDARRAAAADQRAADDNDRQRKKPDDADDDARRAAAADQRAALFVYTSGSTGRPKGVVHSARSLLIQADGLSRAWRVSAIDRVVHGLPLHHVHGLLNALHSPLSSGARVRFLLPRFSAGGAWGALAAEAEEEKEEDGRNLVFHGVPTMYSMMLEALGRGGGAGAEKEASAQRGLAAARDHARLFVCGSAACPPSLWRRWRDETGHPLLERYGMTEAGMILSNPFDASDLKPAGRRSEAGRAGAAVVVEALTPAAAPVVSPTLDDSDDAARVRRPGSVGLPLPGVDVRLVPVPASSGGGDSAERPAAAKPLTIAEALALEAASASDEEAFYALRVRGPSLFSGYWRRDDATREAFSAAAGGGNSDGFFNTGDVVAFDRAGGAEAVRYLRVVGRASADVIKPRGFKVSGLDVEAALLQLQAGGGGGGGGGGARPSPSSPLVSECAVFGVPDARFEGEELVTALVKLSRETGGDDAEAVARALERGLRALLPPYAMPRLWLLLPPGRSIPRNAMGKVNKKALRAALFSSSKGESGARWVGADELGG